MTTLILVRHGESVANAQRRFAGHSNFDLSELGKQQAELAGKYIYENFKVDAIYSSDLKRAYHTALPAANLFSIPVEKRKGLREIFAGEWETLMFSEIRVQYADDFAVWIDDFANARCTEGESVAELYDRICPEILSIAKENDEKCVLITTHATPIRAFECMSMGFGSEHMGDIDFCMNAAINVFEVENGVARLVQKNIIDHLEELKTKLNFEPQA